MQDNQDNNRQKWIGFAENLSSNKDNAYSQKIAGAKTAIYLKGT